MENKTDLSQKIVEKTKEELSSLSNQSKELAKDAINLAKETTIKTAIKIKDTTIEIVDGLNEQDKEIANHYLDGSKYGLPGSNGTCFSNYLRYYANNHEILAICFADKRNPYNKWNRLLSFWSKSCLSFLLFAIFSKYKLQSILELIIVLVIMSPYGYFIDSMATCSYFYRQNCCVKVFHSLGFFILLLTALINIFTLVLAIIFLIYYKPKPAHIVTQFLLSILFDQLQPLYLGIFNWILFSWKGCLCLPQIQCCGCCGCPACPPRFLPILGLYPIQFLLGLYSLGIFFLIF